MPSYVPADVCEVIAGQPAKMKLSANQTAQMISFAVRSAGENADSIVQHGAPLLGFSPATNDVLVRCAQYCKKHIDFSFRCCPYLVSHDLILFRNLESLWP
jgi:hypothetical protein